MPSWVLNAISIGIASTALAERFYSRFYPEVETQKRHLKAVCIWLLNLVAVAAQIWTLVDIWHEKMPTTTPRLLFLVVRVNIAVCFLFSLIYFFVLNAFSVHLVAVLRGQHQLSRDIIDIAKDHSRALGALSASSALEPEIREYVKAVFERDGTSL